MNIYGIAKSLVMIVRGALYRKSAAWNSHPLNRTILPTDFEKLEEELDKAAQAGYFRFEKLIIDKIDFSKFQKKFRVPKLYAVGYRKIKK